MKTCLLLVCLICIFIGTAAKQKPKYRHRTSKYKLPKSFHITNWEKYKMPKEIETDKLKKIMENIAAFKRLEYCPYGELAKCRKAPLTKIVQRVIKKALHNELQDSDDDLIADDVSTINGKNKSSNVKIHKPANETKPSEPNLTENTTSNLDLGENATVSTIVDIAHNTSTSDNFTNANDIHSTTPNIDSTKPNETASDDAKNSGDTGSLIPTDDSFNSNNASDAGESDAAANIDSTNAAGDEESNVLRAKKKQSKHTNGNLPNTSKGNYLKGSMVNVIKMVNFGKNVQYFTESNDGNRIKTNEKYIIQMLQLFERIINVKNYNQF